jgi:hypothetical protein
MRDGRVSYVHPKYWCDSDGTVKEMDCVAHRPVLWQRATERQGKYGNKTAIKILNNQLILSTFGESGTL